MIVAVEPGKSRISHATQTGRWVQLIVSEATTPRAQAAAATIGNNTSHDSIGPIFSAIALDSG
jgi:hypothetical protein